ncbi:hypothetical protein BT96DRAFT_831565 [Gymnopus androsaceus JB14]|uniref:EthD domain-containing protein n=1 Tax=Gymnopus androsaceus JB14 TaxID=1447944 RepID=A0A6A4H242_9AGAR|nr:hypothetical protein BT96DRAFT_831565 [Gymnopus androsaceus JB14]
MAVPAAGNHDQLANGAGAPVPTLPSQPSSRVRMLIAVFKREDVSLEAFQHYWRTTHSKVFLGTTIVKQNILRYEQTRGFRMYVDEEIRTLVKGLGGNTVDWDGAVLYEAESFKKISDVFVDTEFIREVVTSEQRFIDRDRAKVIPVNFIPFLDL